MKTKTAAAATEITRLRAENETLRALLRAACSWDASLEPGCI